MSGAVTLAWADALAAYDFGPAHPLAPVRVVLTMSLARELGVLDAPSLSLVDAKPASDKDLLRVHDAEYIDAVRTAGTPPVTVDLDHGLGTGDNPVFEHMHEASSLVAGASAAVARAVWSGAAEHGINIAGGLHHAMRRTASGFCIYNDAAVAIAALLDEGAAKVAYVDIDVHHGDGVQAAFYDDPRVLTISLHETGRYLFPGTGFPDETGAFGAEGTSVNVALPPAVRDSGWLRAFHAVVPPLLRAFAPDVLVTQHGCDSHVLDPLAHLALTVDGQRSSYVALHRLAHEVAGGRWVVLGGGGYELVEVVPRAWTHLIGEVAGVPIDPQTPTPELWRAEALDRTGEHAPHRMTDGGDVDYEPFTPYGADDDDPVDAAIIATRMAVFPFHGLDPSAP